MSDIFTPFDPLKVDLTLAGPRAYCVEASAGTGKTFSITGLVLRLICEEALTLDQILVVTFTRAAAAELQGRIAERLESAERTLEEVLRKQDEGAGEQAESAQPDDAFLAEWLRECLGLDPITAEVLSKGQDAAARHQQAERWLQRVRNARQRVDSATFATIHSFCQRMLEWHAFESNQPLGLGFLEDADTQINEIANDLQVELAELLPEEVHSYLGKRLDELSGVIGEAFQHRDSILYTEWDQSDDDFRKVFDGLLDSILEHYTSFFTAERVEKLTEHMENLEGFAVKGDWSARFRELEYDKLGWPAHLHDFLARNLRQYEKQDWLGSSFWSEFVATFSNERLLRKGLSSAAKNVEMVNAFVHAPVLEELSSLNEAGVTPDALAARICVAAAREARRRSNARLAARSEATFDDLITRLGAKVEEEAAKLATGGDAADAPLVMAIRERYRAALIDEFQDTDLAQWTIFKGLFLQSEEHRLFLIGDPKQAIYSFRGADIQTYLRARSEVARTPEGGRRRGALCTMKRNYRSDGALIAALNRFMGMLWSETEETAPDFADAGSREDLLNALAQPPTAVIQGNSAAGATQAQDPKDGPAADAAPAPGRARFGFFDSAESAGASAAAGANTGTGSEGERPAGDSQSASEGDSGRIGFILVDWQKPRPRDVEGAAAIDCLATSAPARAGSDDQNNDKAFQNALTSLRAGPEWSAQPLIFRPFRVKDEQLEPGKLILRNREGTMTDLWPAVAGDVKRLLQSGTRIAPGDDKGTDKAVNPRDIAILVDKWADGRALYRALLEAGIPAVIGRGESVYESDDAADLALLLSSLLRPRHQSLRNAALATALLSLPAAALRDLGDDGGQDADRWQSLFVGWEKLWRESGLLRLMGAILELRVDQRSLPVDAGADPKSRYPTRREALLAHQDGERRLTNLRQLVELLHAEVGAKRLGPESTLDLLHQRMAGRESDGKSPDDPRKQQLETDEDAVRIATVHGAKGLEYPIVFLPTVAERNVVSKVECPVTIPSGKPGQRTLYATKHLLNAAEQGTPDGELSPKQHREKHALEESRRKLYVAMTRAKHQVVVYAVDWSDNLNLPLLADVGAKNPSHAVLKSALGRAVDSIPRVRRAGQALNEGRSADDAEAPILFSDVCEALGRAVNPIGVPLDTRTPWIAPRSGRVGHAPNAGGTPKAEATALPGHGGGHASDAEGADALRTLERFDAFVPPDKRFYEVSYRQTSFSALGSGGSHTLPEPLLAQEESEEERGAGDEQDLELLEDEAGGAGREVTPSATPGILLEAGGLAGREFGDLMHNLLEEVDFAVAADGGGEQEIQALLARHLQRQGFTIDEQDVGELAKDVLRVLQAPLGGELGATSLSRIPRARRLDEMEFHIPLERVLNKDALVDAFRSGPGPEPGTSWEAAGEDAWERWLMEVEKLNFQEVRGYLKGFIDLIFEAEVNGTPKIHLLDYKTNKRHRRGFTREQAAAGYAQEALVEVMIESRYVLQYHLYAVALYRYLKQRRRDHDWDRDVGVVCYPFLRGMGAETAVEAKQGTLQRGVFIDRVPLARVEALDRLFREDAGAGGAVGGEDVRDADVRGEEARP